MHIGLLKETKPLERRVALPPAGVLELVRGGHQVRCEEGAGLAAGFPDNAYLDAGATLCTKETVYAQSQMVLHVREPQPEEYPLFRADQIVFAYLHLGGNEALGRALLAAGAVGISCDAMRDAQGRRPMVEPMSEMFGRLAVIEAAKHLESHLGGKGKLLGGVTGTDPGTVIVLGGGAVGAAAARTAAGLGSQVYVLEEDLDRLRHLAATLPARCTVLLSTGLVLRQLLPRADVLIGAAGRASGPAPCLLAEEDLDLLEPGSVLVDITVDRGGCFAGTRPTSHEAPVYVAKGLVRYNVPNIPAAMPHTATVALSNVSLRYLRTLADEGWLRACARVAELRAGCCLAEGRVLHPALAEAWGLPLTAFDTLSL